MSSGLSAGGRKIENILTNAKLITAILPKGRGIPLQKSLIEEKGIHSAVIHHARGVGRFSSIQGRGIGEQQEREVLDVTIPADKAEEIFEYMFFTGELNHPHGGIMFLTSIPATTPMELPDLLDEEVGESQATEKQQDAEMGPSKLS